MPRRSVNNIPQGFKDHMKNRFALLNLIAQEPEELWTETRTVGEGCERTVKGKGKSRWMAAETLEMVQDGRQARAKGGKSSV